ncbi:MAG: metallophosphoesterase [Cellulosilyticaceae bacterium]
MAYQSHKGKKSKWFSGILGIVLVMVGGGFYSRFIEPKLLYTKHVSIVSPSVKEDLEGYKIVQFTDTQLGDFYTIEDLEKAVKRINSLEADVVVFTGDLIDHMKSYEGDWTQISSLLGAIQAKDGKFAVYGNHDQGGGAHKTYPKIMEKAGFNILKNEVYPLKIGDEVIQFIGLDDWLLGFPELENTLSGIRSDAFNVLLLHEPDVVELVAPYPVDLQLSGHTHGGQVRLPFCDPPITPPLGHKYTHGIYKINERLQLYVNTGLGNTRVPYRLMNIPEITLFTLTSKP